MSLSQIVQLAPPPESPHNAPTQEQWREYEEKLGTSLPADYKELLSTYGSGTLEANNLRLQIYSNCSSEFSEDIEYLNDRANDYFVEVWEEDNVPYGIFPKTPGLLAFGVDDTNCLYYLVDGPPETWSIFGFALRGGECHEEFKCSLSVFILKLLENRLESEVLYRSPVAEDPESIQFDPYE
ncbi:MAG: SMI1/KNR4 family protein [bacterium]|nr:SMI1/KNR4 family protein [bacterium]